MDIHLLYSLYFPSTTTSIHLPQPMLHLKRLNHMGSSILVVVHWHHAWLASMMLGCTMMSIVFDDDEMERSKSNPIMVYNSNDELENSKGLSCGDPVIIHNDKDLCAHCNQQGHQQEDCGTPMCSLNFHLSLHQTSSLGSLKDRKRYCYDFHYPSPHFLVLPFY